MYSTIHSLFVAGAAGAAGPSGNSVSPPTLPAGGSGAAGGGSAASLPAGWEEKVGRLMALGFGREMCVQALQATSGNEELAGSMLFGGI